MAIRKWNHLTLSRSLAGLSVLGSGKIVATSDKQIADYLDALGDLGWEMVGVAGTTTTYLVTFKRPKG